VAPGSVLLSTIVGVTLATGGFAIGLGTTGIAEGSTSFWYLSRASGFVAYVLLWGSVVWGPLYRVLSTQRLQALHAWSVGWWLSDASATYMTRGPQRAAAVDRG